MDRVHLLGIAVDPLTQDGLTALVVQGVADRRRWVIANHNLHSVFLYHHDRELKAFYDAADFSHIDGMPIVLLGRLLGRPLNRAHRVTYVDWIRPLLAEAARRGFRVFYLGSRPGVAEAGAAILTAEFTQLHMEVQHGFFSADAGSSENRDVLEQIRAFRPDILMVGMGMPRQELWVARNLETLDAGVILMTGACMDYVAGMVATPPRWLGQLGLEWAYRLFTEPRRLWRRYLVEPWFVLGLFAKDVWKRQ